ncbi:hypothetical protein Ppa06_08550 [Planomonospora parontospora subsp. parontospora]|uniref:Uncharacterized protein n=2 Tax=Planomonospora parontospora TaxID=58119 RepID=A0AA37BD56_9ACTN|nr:hypothetical protein GCM10010126_08060 [Planomonospora parontospora]GII07057.1 hypothetical protein Ppa06_08550 [Planomonospora parontospora subsp. parontospora]
MWRVYPLVHSATDRVTGNYCIPAGDRQEAGPAEVAADAKTRPAAHWEPPGASGVGVGGFLSRLLGR